MSKDSVTRKAAPAVSDEREAELLDRLSAGDNEAFGQLLRAYQPRVYGLVRKLVTRREEAMELTQDIFLAAFRSKGRFDPRRSFKSWLFGIAVNLCRNHRRAGARREQATLLEPGVMPMWREAEPSAEEDLAAEGAKALVQRHLAGLSPDDREILLLRYREELSYADMSRIYRRPETVLKMRVHRAFKRLEALVKGELQ